MLYQKWWLLSCENQEPTAEHQFLLKITDLQYIFLGGGGQNEIKAFKNGTLKFINEDDSMELLKQVMRLKPHIPNKAPIRRKLYTLMRMSNNYKKLADAIIVAAKGLKAGHVKFSENPADFYSHILRIYQEAFKVN